MQSDVLANVYHAFELMMKTNVDLEDQIFSSRDIFPL
jgi:hypothetical protein